MITTYLATISARCLVPSTEKPSRLAPQLFWHERMDRKPPENCDSRLTESSQNGQRARGFEIEIIQMARAWLQVCVQKQIGKGDRDSLIYEESKAATQ